MKGESRVDVFRVLNKRCSTCRGWLGDMNAHGFPEAGKVSRRLELTKLGFLIRAPTAMYVLFLQKFNFLRILHLREFESGVTIRRKKE